uniref:Si:dkey-71h2.2 n=1 Tax=Amphiprion percula TaxID=161767 RepID=A0A3P8S4K0_AMPPE
MDAFKSAGRAIIKSPGVPRHAWGTSKHEKLPENWTDTKETLLEGMVFNVKYLGMTLVVQPKGEDMASAAIHRIVAMARASAKKFRKVTLTVSPKGIIITDTETADLIENVSIYRYIFSHTAGIGLGMAVLLKFLYSEPSCLLCPPDCDSEIKLDMPSLKMYQFLKSILRREE